MTARRKRRTKTRKTRTSLLKKNCTTSFRISKRRKKRGKNTKQSLVKKRLERWPCLPFNRTQIHSHRGKPRSTRPLKLSILSTCKWTTCRQTMVTKGKYPFKLMMFLLSITRTISNRKSHPSQHKPASKACPRVSAVVMSLRNYLSSNRHSSSNRSRLRSVLRAPTSPISSLKP